MKKVEVKEPCTIYKFGKNGFGDLTITESFETKCLFIFGQARNESNYEEITTTDAHAYLDIDDKNIQSIMTKDMKKNSYYFVIERYGREDWYKIDRIKIGRTILTDNQDNNVHAFLSFSEKMIEESN